MADRGVYFLADDGVFDQVVAFLNSFRAVNPVTPLCLIPFSSDHGRVMGLRHRYRFNFWQDDALLARCDAISRLFHGRTMGHYRKFALWEGPFAEFVYIDCDTVVLASVDRVFEVSEAFEVVTAFSDDLGSRHWVWKDSIDTVGALDARQVRFAANTGVVASRRGVLPFDDIVRRVPAAVALALHMELSCFEQPALNYMIVTGATRYTSLHALVAVTGRKDIPVERWAGDPSLVVRHGQVVYPESPQTLLVHWAGQWERSRRTGDPLPYRDLWNYYRYRDA